MIENTTNEKEAKLAGKSVGARARLKDHFPERDLRCIRYVGNTRSPKVRRVSRSIWNVGRRPVFGCVPIVARRVLIPSRADEAKLRREKEGKKEELERFHLGFLEEEQAESKAKCVYGTTVRVRSCPLLAA